MGSSPCCDEVGVKRGTWTSDEDQKLVTFIQQNGHGSWPSLPAKAGLRRCGKSCRLRWNNYLRPDIKRGKFSLTEERTIMQMHALLGNRWSTIASYLPKRTDNDIKNFWNTHLKKKLIKMGIDPVTHKPRFIATLFPGQERAAADLSHMAQWERARLQAEAMLTRSQSKPAPTTYGPPATAFNAPASYRVDNPLDDGFNELMKIVGQKTNADVEKCDGFGHTIYSDTACVANNDIFWSDQKLSSVLTRNNVVESDELTWNNLVGAESATLTYGEASGGFPMDIF